jgi:hypothetical protein
MGSEVDKEPVISAAVTGQGRPISEVVGEIWSDLPDDARAQLPADGAAQVDHYVYGLPKRDQ